MLEDRLKEELIQIEKMGSLRQFRTISYLNDQFTINGKPLINLASNDYLGLGAREDLVEMFFKQELDQKLPTSAFGSTSSRLLTGNFEVMDQLEDLLKNTYRREAALVFNSGYHMNVGIISAIADKNTLVIADKLVHASMIDGLRLTNTRFERFRHNDIDGLERIVKRNIDNYDELIIMVESVYSMDGDVADLRKLVNLKRRYSDKIILYVDEAHAAGVFGENGLGLSESLGVIQEIDILCATFGKAMAGMGGYIVTSQTIKDYLINRSRSLIFSTALPPIIYQWNKFIFQQIQSFNEERNALHMKAAKIRQLAKDRGFDMPSSSQIIPFIFGDNELALQASDYLNKEGYFCPAVRPPTVPQGTARLRLSLTASTDIANLEVAIDALSKFKRQ